MTTFGTWLQQRRKTLDLTREELAQRVGCSASLVRKLETDARKPSKQMAQILAEQLHVVPEQHERFVQFARGLTPQHSTDGHEDWQTEGAVPTPLSPVQSVEPGAVPGTPHFKLQPSLARPTNLTRPLTALLGREHELQTLRTRILRDDARLITLAGPPGIGKTQLALELAYGLLNTFEDGVFWVPLAPLADANLVAPAILQALHLSSSADLPARFTLKHLLRDKQLLLVLDNFEHVLPAAELVTELLAECVYVKVIATSREPLRIRGERQFVVPPLLMPSAETMRAEPAWLNYPAVALFVERAQAVNADFQLDETNGAAVLEICQSVDGIPLGIELAASWVNALSCAEIAQEIRHNLDFLAVNMQDMPARHRSLRAAFDHSWKLLPAHEQAVLSRLTVFRGGLTREAAEEVAGATLADLSALIAKSLLRRNEAGRYDLHEFMRQYAAEKLLGGARDADDAPVAQFETQRAHARFYTDMARNALEQSETIGPDETLWLDRLDTEHDNVRVALDWAAGEADPTLDKLEIGLALAGALWFFWYVRGYLAEGAQRLNQLLAQSSRQLTSASNANTGSAHEQAHTRALVALGWLEAVQAHFDAARAVLDGALTRARAAQDGPTLAWALTFVAYVANVQNELPLARLSAEEAIAIWQRLGDARRAGWPLRMLADNALRAGDTVRAQALFSQTLPAGHHTSNQVFPLRRLAKVLQLQGDMAQAKTLLHQALQLSMEVQDKIGLVACMAGLASRAVAENELEVAAKLYGVVDQWLQTLNTVLEPFDRGEQARDMSHLRTHLAPALLAGCLREGQSWSQDQAIAYALEG